LQKRFLNQVLSRRSVTGQPTGEPDQPPGVRHRGSLEFVLPALTHVWSIIGCRFWL
jgi:hypothetical protein